MEDRKLDRQRTKLGGFAEWVGIFALHSSPNRGEIKDAYYFDILEVESEVLHDLRWPRLRIRSTDEVISVAMGKRICTFLILVIPSTAFPVTFAMSSTARSIEIQWKLYFRRIST